MHAFNMIEIIQFELNMFIFGILIAENVIVKLTMFTLLLRNQMVIIKCMHIVNYL